MDVITIVASVSIFSAAICIMAGAAAAGVAEGKASAQALDAIAKQPDESGNISKTLFISMAMIESSAIYCFVVTMILLFANPFWTTILERVGK